MRLRRERRHLPWRLPVIASADESGLCPLCDGALRTRVGDRRYDECGIAGITLVDVEIGECLRCGWSGAATPEPRQLIETIAKSIVGRAELRLRFVDGRWARV